MNGDRQIMIIGAAIADILLCPVDESVFAQGSCGVDSIRMDVGGDALNESTVLARLGHPPVLVTKLGWDGVAEFILERCRQEDIEVQAVRDPGLDTGINAVLVKPDGERCFVTNRRGSLRRLALEDIEPALETEAFDRARFVCLASMFVSPMLPLRDMETLFARIKAAGKCLCADTTKRKNGETLADAAGALCYVDYFFPNLEEARLLTGLDAPESIADALLEAGVGCVALKLGRRGCLLARGVERIEVPAYPGTRCVDTTGAGDTFAAAFIAALAEGEDLLRCGCYANAAASVAVERVGATAARLTAPEVIRRRDAILNQMQKN